MNENGGGVRDKGWAGSAALGVLVLGLVAGGGVWARLPTWRLERAVSDLADPAKRLDAEEDLQAAGAGAVPLLIETLQRPTAPQRREALALLGRIGDLRALPAVLALQDPDLAEGRLRALGGLVAPESLEELLRTVRETTSYKLELAALHTLRGWPNAAERLGPLFEEYLEHHQAGYRMYAAEGLGLQGWSQAVPRLIERLKDDHPGVREAAALALIRLGDPAGVEAVERAVESGQVVFTE